MSTQTSIRPSPIAGSWYPADAKKLAAEVMGYVNAALMPVLPGRVVGLIAPHAGYFYSGATAGYAYRAVKDLHFDVCVVVSPLHNYLPYPLISSAHSAYATPFGEISIDHDLLQKFQMKLSESGLPPIKFITNDHEHSLEIQLPFLQCVLKDACTLLPLMIRSTDYQFLRSTAVALASILQGKNILLIASTDLSHFYPEKNAEFLDHEMLKRMTAFSAQAVLQAEEEQSGFACGVGAVALVLETARELGADQVTLLHHSTSAQASGDPSSVVGYGALAITRQEAP